MADLDTARELQFYTLRLIIRESMRIPFTNASAPFLFITLTLILPFSVFQLWINDHHYQILTNIFNHYGFDQFYSTDQIHQPSFTDFIYGFFYYIFLLTFSLVSTAAMVFTVASHYTSLPVTFPDILVAICRMFKPLFITLLYCLPLMILYTFIFIVSMDGITKVDFTIKKFSVFNSGVKIVIFIAVHAYVIALWQLACVISVLERNVYGLKAMKRSRQLMRGKTGIAFQLVVKYLAVVFWTPIVFRWLMVDNHHHGYNWITGFVRIMCLVMLVVANFIGLLVQSVFYHVCKSHHHQEIDKRLLYNHLSGYLGEPLRRTTAGTTIELDII